MTFHQRSFPIVRHQWEATARLREPIMERARASLADHGLSAQAVAEALVTVLLLDEAQATTYETVFDELLQRRFNVMQGALATAVEVGGAGSCSSSDVARALEVVIRTLRATLKHVGDIFKGESSYLGSIVKQLQRGVPLGPHPVSNNDTTNVDARSVHHHHYPLFDSTKTNIHLLLRYLPAATFVPDTMRWADHTTDDISEDCVHAWVERVRTMVVENGARLLKAGARSGSELMAVQEALVPVIRECDQIKV